MNIKSKHSKHFRLFANCIPVKGHMRSIICDLQRGEYEYIPNDLIEIINNCKTKAFNEVISAYGKENKNIITEYFQFLLDKDYGFWTDEIESFPDLNLQWDAPALITNAIIDSNNDSNHDFQFLMEQLDKLGCRDLQLRFFTSIQPEQLEQILNITKELQIKSIDLVLKYLPTFDLPFWNTFCKKHLRLNQIFIYNAPNNKIKRVFYDKNKKSEIAVINFQKSVIDSHQKCGIINPAYFNVGIELFTEAQKHNTCLNRKISIDTNGDIRNCPSMSKSFGNIKNTTLHEALLKNDFKEYWYINKDQISVCKDCEYRYICSDCRAFVQENDNKYSKPAKCSYDPYSATWLE